MVSFEKMVREHLDGIDRDRVSFHRVDHHDCHAYAAYGGLADDLDKKYLVLTLDGGGDHKCATVQTGHKGLLSDVARTESGNSVGNLYSITTYLLGFTPHEHEYKLMGLASYVPSDTNRP